MTDDVGYARLAVLAMCSAPALVLGAIFVAAVTGRRWREAALARLMTFSLSVAAAGASVLVGFQCRSADTTTTWALGDWFAFGGGRFTFEFVLDRYSVTFAALASFALGVVGAFSFRYLHRDPGYQRYFAQLSLLALGLTLVSLAGSVEVLFAGWELTGLSSALLVGYFHERPTPVDNALRVFAVYRVGDAAMLAAAVLLHHWAHSGSLSLIFDATSDSLRHGQLLAITLLLLVAVSAKSALLPFSGWLPRAMEGPTPSSAVFYGALSIHAGCMLLLRGEALLVQSPLARWLAIFVGAATAIYAALVGRAQTDVKSVVSYAALTQVGVIVIEIGVGWTTLALVHIVLHTTFRLVQFLLAPNVLADTSNLRTLDLRGASTSAVPSQLRSAIYLFALERGFVDRWVEVAIVHPFVWVATKLDALDRLLSGAGKRDPH